MAAVINQESTLEGILPNVIEDYVNDIKRSPLHFPKKDIRVVWKRSEVNDTSDPAGSSIARLRSHEAFAQATTNTTDTKGPAEGGVGKPLRARNAEDVQLPHSSDSVRRTSKQ